MDYISKHADHANKPEHGDTPLTGITVTSEPLLQKYIAHRPPNQVDNNKFHNVIVSPHSYVAVKTC